MLEPLFSKVAGPEACLSMNFAKLLRTRFYRTAPVAATDYSGLYIILYQTGTAHPLTRRITPTLHEFS